MGEMPAPSKPQPQPTTIGVYLQWARTQKGLELSEVEERTKIRSKYLQALETEAWSVIPSSAYARGFLATYAKLLDLDADKLVDEYRRQVETEEPTANLSAYGEPVLEGRRRVGAPGSPLRPLIVVFLIALVVVVVVVAFIADSGGDSDHKGGKRPGRTARTAPAAASSGSAGGESVELKLHAKSGMTVCLVGDGGEPLVDGQTLSAGARVGPFTAAHYRLDVDTGGVVKLKLGNELRRLTPKRPASYRVMGTTVSSIPYKGGSCP